MRKLILYGTGLEGEKFYSWSEKLCDIAYCIDKRNNRSFHGKPVYSLEEKELELKNFFIIVAAQYNIYKEIRDDLVRRGLIEFKNFTYYILYGGAKLAIIYGNCHMAKLCEYFCLNYFFLREYHLRYYYIAENECPSNVELENCSLFLAQDIREDNGFHMPGTKSLINSLKTDSVKIVIPNLYGCNLFFMQCFSPNDNQIGRHLYHDAIDIDSYDVIKAQRIRVSAESVGKRDQYIDECYKKGMDAQDIKESILNDEIWNDESIKKNFLFQMEKLKKREEKCDIQISDYIEEHYRYKLLFYEPFHPTEDIIAEIGRRVLKILLIPLDEEVSLGRSLDAMEMPVYGCVKRALGLKFEQKILRRHSSATLMNRAESLEEYVKNYLVWVWGKQR